MDEYLTQVYYNPKSSGGLGGVERLYRDVKKDGKYDISRTQITLTENSHMISHMKFSYVKSLCGIGTIHI